MDDIVIRKAKFEDLEEICFTLSDSLANTKPAIRYWWRIMENQKIHTLVAEQSNTVVGTATLHVLEKLIHGGSFVGLIEDVSVKDKYQGKGIGKLLIEELIKIAEDKKCYKVILNCNKEVKTFYEKMGFKSNEIQMRLDIKD